MADDITTPRPQGEPLKTAATKAAKPAKEKVAAAAKVVGDEAGKATSTAAATFKDSAAKLQKQATGKAMAYVEDGKAKAGGALDEFSRLMDNAATSVDGSIGAEYGDYARSAAKAISGFSDQLKAKDVDALLADLRDFARKSPAVAVGTAAAIGFVLARLVKSGLDSADRDA
ncbi:hypothetical protein EAH87_02615 [Sphingomonas koreensis]|nr:hypothetical protein EAH87_02615 [Sphingomonas koreensis]